MPKMTTNDYKQFKQQKAEQQDLHYTHTHAHTHAQTHARPHAHTHTHTHTHSHSSQLKLFTEQVEGTDSLLAGVSTV